MVISLSRDLVAIIRKKHARTGVILTETPSNIKMSAGSGIGVSDDVVQAYNLLKDKKTNRYLIFKLNDKNDEVVVDKLGNRDETWNNFTDSLPADHCRYAVFDFPFETKEGGSREKICLFPW